MSADSRLIVQKFIQYALADLTQDFVTLSFLPLPAEMLCSHPDRILAPKQGSEMLDMAEVGRLGSTPIVGVCLATDDYDMAAARRILKHCAFSSMTVFVVFLLPDDMVLDSEMSDRLLRQHDVLLNLGVTDVLINPEMREGNLRSSLGVMCTIRDHMMYRLKQHLEEIPPARSNQKLETTQNELKKLLWESVPQALMPHFPRVDRNVEERADGTGVGKYSYLYPCQCSRNVMHALCIDGTQTAVAVKKTAKIEVQTSDELEGIYREFRLLTAIIDHPNIVKCIDILHTENYYFMIMEDAGNRNLSAFCEEQPGQRLCQDQAMDCWQQIASPVGWMHQQGICHRNLSLTHVVLNLQGEDRFHCKLVDFRAAVVCQGDQTSGLKVGTLPYVAPEVILQDCYSPRLADCWSAGIVLLEIAGGLTSTIKSAGVEEGEENPEDVVQAIYLFFQQSRSHEEALAKLGGVHSPEILRCLQSLIQHPAGARMSLSDLADSLKHS